MADPTWTPSLVQVAAYIPSRTRKQNNLAADELAGTFTDVTTPTDQTVTATFIPNAVAEVTGVCGVIPATLGTLATEAAALRAAADIELAYAERDADVEVYRDLDQRAKDALARLLEACRDAGGTGEATLPVWAFPDPPWYGDVPL